MERKQIKLTAKERTEIQRFCTTGVHSVRLANRARIILALDTSAGKKAETQGAVACRVGVSCQTVSNAKRDFLAAQSVSAFLQRKKRQRPPVPPKLTGELEARLISLACGKAPAGYARWTLRLLAEKCVELRFCDAISHTSVSSLLKKHSLNLI